MTGLASPPVASLCWWKSNALSHCIIVSAWTCMIMEFQLVDGVQFFLVLSALVALPPQW